MGETPIPAARGPAVGSQGRPSPECEATGETRPNRPRWLGEVRQMSAIGTEETIDRAGGLVGLLG
jgi:hypothetical protein